MEKYSHVIEPYFLYYINICYIFVAYKISWYALNVPSPALVISLPVNRFPTKLSPKIPITS